MARTPTRSVTIAFGGQTSVVVGTAAAVEGDEDLPVTRLTGNTTLTASGTYIVDSAAAIRTITLPLLSGAPTEGYVITVKREGANYVDVDANGADEIEPSAVTTLRLFTNWSAVKLVADDAANVWYLQGFYGAVT